MVPPAPRECNQPACTAHCIATSSQRIGPRISRASQRTARMQPARAQHIANNPRTVQGAACTDNQPVEVRASHPVQRPRIALRGPHTLLSTLRWFRFVWFVELFFLKFNIYTFLFLNISWLIRHTG